MDMKPRDISNGIKSEDLQFFYDWYKNANAFSPKFILILIKELAKERGVELVLDPYYDPDIGTKYMTSKEKKVHARKERVKEKKMAGKERPKCIKCGKYYKYDWTTETFKKSCECKED